MTDSTTDNTYHRKAIFWFLAINACVSACLNYAYIVLAPGMDSLVSRIYVHGALISTISMVYLLLGLLFLLPSRWIRGTWILVVLVGLICFLHILNVLDIIIFRIFRYHINSMVLTLVFTEGARDSLHLGAMTVITYALGATAVVAMELWIARICLGRLARKPWTSKVVAASVIFALVVLAAEKTAYALADLYSVQEITRYTRVFPLYQRVTIKRFVRKHFGVKVDAWDIVSVRRRGDTLVYPSKRLERVPLSTYPNIVWIVIDAWRFDMLNEEVTPNVLAFSRKALVFTDHLSGGNCTRFGIFTLFYGVYGTYWHQFLGENQSPVLLDELKGLGYDFRIISSSSLSNPEFRRTVFAKLAPYITDDLPGSKADTRDPALARTFISWLGSRDVSKPFFAFLFFDAPHGPYIYPDEYDRFKPSNRSPNYVTTGEKDAVSLFNSYRNAVSFDDHLIAGVLKALEHKGLLANTIVLITGDHGEEFFETGFWGHTSTFSRYQTGVSCVLYIPGHSHAVVDRPTSHLDIVPTFMRLLGYTTEPAAYSQGHDMLADKEREYRVVAGWDQAALVYKDITIVMPTQGNLAGALEVRWNKGYRPADQERQFLRQRQKDLVGIMEGMSTFLR